jgi:hypothetical protein
MPSTAADTWAFVIFDRKRPVAMVSIRVLWYWKLV